MHQERGDIHMANPIDWRAFTYLIIASILIAAISLVILEKPYSYVSIPICFVLGIFHREIIDALRQKGIGKWI
jgi:hypothetical protein